MIEPALMFLTALGAKSAEPKKLYETDREITFSSMGEIERFQKPPAPRSHAPATLDEIIALANRFAKDEAQSKPVVWYDDEHVVLVIDDQGHRIETATLALEKSDVFIRFIELRRRPEWMDPKAFIRLLRVDLARTLDPGVLLDKVRKLKFENGQALSSDIRRGNESLGREITSKVEAPIEVPEEVIFSAPVFKTPGETDRLPIYCLVDIDPARAALMLLPAPDEIERVVDMAVRSIGQRLAEGLDKDVPAYYGRPAA